MSYHSVLNESLALHEKVMQDAALKEALEQLIASAVACLKGGGKIMFCGNGGSAADAQHLAAELSGRFAYDRPPLPAEALHVNTSYLTAVANDYSFDEVYARMVQAIGKPGDLLVALSTSGNSPNVNRAVIKAKEMGIMTAGFTGKNGGDMINLCNINLLIPSGSTPRIQEMHILLGHVFCEEIETAMFPH